jgi:transcriptional regulator of nitric oxide reductase
MKEEAGGPPPYHPVTVTTDRVVTLTTSFTLAGSVPQATMQAERKHKEAWRRLAHQPGVTLGAVIDVKAWGIMVEALRRIAKSEDPHASMAEIAREALFQIGDRSVAPLDDTDMT